MPKFENKIIEVCSECYCASCWHGEFLCPESTTAGTELKTVSELRIIDVEHESTWADGKMNDIYGEYAPHGYREVF